VPIAESTLVLTAEDGSTRRHPVYKSTMIKFERRYGRPYAPASIADAATMAYYLDHEQTWPPSRPPEVLEDWFDSVRFEVDDSEPEEANGDRPTGPSAQD
jgi:hypothetical protein